MDSFFSLFDPSEGHSKQKNKIKQKPEQDTAKKKPEVTKGRRRGRKSAGKSETLPEESSFLCEPHLGTELLVKDVSYIENFIEVSKKVDESKQDDKKPKRRNSNRKTRRKKHKVSPCKDLVPTSGWNDDTTWNNRASVSRINLENVGKNVNDLKDSNKNVDGQESDSDGADVRNNRGDDSDSDGTEFKKNRDAAGRGFKYNRPDDSGSDVVRRNTDGQDTEESDFRKNGDGSSSDASFNNELRSAKRNVDVDSVISKLEKVLLKDDMYLAGDFDCNDLDKEEFYSSDDMEEYIDDSTSEPDDSGDEVYGSLPPEPRFGNVEYKLQLVSLCEKRFQHLVTQLKWRLRSGGGSCVYVIGVRDCGALVGLRARALRDSLRALRRMASALGAELAHVTARRVAPHRAVAEVTVRKLPDPKQSVELRVAVMGANEAGKSTLIGVLTQGELDNGRGSARLNMFRHLHEVKSGRTSSLSHEILGFDAQGNVVNYGCSELMTAERIGERSAKLVSFLDLAGHSKYQRTTLHGLTGYCPHYAMLVISATAGITPITEEHISLLSALDLPFFTVISKCELAPTALKTLVGRLGELFAPVNKKPLLITDENSARNCVAPQTLILDTLDGDKEHTDEQSEVVPVFPVSCVKGVGLSALHAYLLALRPPHGETPIQRLDDEEVEFQIDEVFHVGDSTGPVVGGLLVKGQLKEGDNVLIGPCESGAFLPCLVRSVHRNRVACFGASAGQSASVALGLGPDAPRPRPGLVLLSRPRGDKRPTHHEMTELIRTTERNLLDNSKNRKNVRRKNKNLLQDLAIAEVGLTKDTHSEERNIYHEEEKGEALEDPNDPRGCIYFQASVQLLRHASAMCPGFQCTVHVGNVRQTAVIEGIMSRNSELRAPEKASALFRFVRFPEYLVRGRRMLFTAGLGTRGIGRITQIFPHIP